jgi:hypothetical protein
VSEWSAAETRRCVAVTLAPSRGCEWLATSDSSDLLHKHNLAYNTGGGGGGSKLPVGIRNFILQKSQI